MNVFADLWPVAAELAAKSVALLAVAAVVALCLRKSSAARRHLVWAAAVAGMLLLPLLSIALSRTGVAVAAPMPTLPSASAPATGEPPASIPATTAVADPAAPAADAVAAAVSAPTVSAGFRDRIRTLLPRALLPAVLVALWLAVAGLLLVRLSASHAAARRLVNRVAVIEAGPLADALAEARREMGTARPVLLCVGMSEGGPAAPLMLGHRRPVILLPHSAEEWSAERLRVVLLHELAHVRRRDWLWQMAAQVACALYWWNPVVWFAARRLRAESELASDDLVLTTGVAPSDYAGHLLDIARSLRSRSALPSAAVAMARKPEIHGRLQAIFSGSRRIGLTRRAAAVACAASLAVVMFVAACRPNTVNGADVVPMHSENVPLPQDVVEWHGPWKATLSNGAVVELLAIGHKTRVLGRDSWTYWSPEGIRVQDPAPDVEGASVSGESLQFVLRHTMPPSQYFGGDQVGGSTPLGSETRLQSIVQDPSQKDPLEPVFVTKFETKVSEDALRDVASTSFRFGVQAEEPIVAASAVPGHGGRQIGPPLNPVFERKEPLGPGTTVRLTYPRGPGIRYSVIALDRKGKSHSFMYSRDLDGDVFLAHFPDLAENDIAEIRYLIIPLRYVEFKDIPLTPEAAKATVRSKDVAEWHGPWKAALSNGAVVELVAIGRNDVSDEEAAWTYWTPDGRGTAEPWSELMPMYPRSDPSITFGLRITDPTAVGFGDANGLSVDWHSDIKFTSAAMHLGDYRDPDVREAGGLVYTPRLTIRISDEESRQLTDLRIGAAVGPADLTARNPAPGREGEQSGNALNPVFVPHENVQPPHYRVEFSFPRHEGVHYSITAIDEGGKEHLPGVMNTFGPDKLRVHFRDVPQEDIVEFRLYARPYRYVEFKDIPLHPAGTIIGR